MGRLRGKPTVYYLTTEAQRGGKSLYIQHAIVSDSQMIAHNWVFNNSKTLAGYNVKPITAFKKFIFAFQHF